MLGRLTLLWVLLSPDMRLDADISPKPTIFLPSIAEINLHKAGTYLCLLEKFFPDVIKIHWKEKNGRTVLESQQGNTVKTNDTYMKFSWLTVTEKSMDKEYKCIVTHEKNKGGVDQEILFPSVNEVVTAINSTKTCLKNEYEFTAIDSTKACQKDEKEVLEVTANNSTKTCLKDEYGTLQLQLTNTSAYYTYLLLLLKSLVYFAVAAGCLLGRTTVCGNAKSS
ncbi:T Cell Receptor Gamma Constant 2 [Manis pentadactyla]|nr:T Cell Receptor Gamma Constant 2 [Manis pentadactyla]